MKKLGEARNELLAPTDRLLVVSIDLPESRVALVAIFRGWLLQCRTILVASYSDKNQKPRNA